MDYSEIISNVKIHGLEESILASGYPMSIDVKTILNEKQYEGLKYYMSIDILNIVNTIKNKLQNVELYDYYFSFIVNDNICKLNYEDYELVVDNVHISGGYLANSNGHIHKQIVSEEGKYTDHINKDKFDNRRINLRTCTPQQNNFNTSISKNNSSGVTGVSYRKDKNKWRAYISPNGKQISLGHYANKEDAIKARLKAEIEYFGEFAPQLYLCEQYQIDNPYKKEVNTYLNALDAIKHLNRIYKLSAAKAGSGHDNALKGIIVQFDWTFTAKCSVEIERYHFIDFVSSQSTMHKITKFDLDKAYIGYVDKRCVDVIKELTEEYNALSEDVRNGEYGKNLYLRILYSNPCGILLTARMTTNYQQLKTMYAQRKNHRLPEWRAFCAWCETLPHSEFITGKIDK